MEIKVTKNGPYIVSGDVLLDEVKIIKEGSKYKYIKSMDFKKQKKYFLCRCGKSKKPPYCDGAHTKEEFDGTCKSTQAKYEDDAIQFENDFLILKDNTNLCASASFCTTDETNIWKLIKQNKKENNSKIKEMAFNCPSGRLVIIEKDKEVEPNIKNKVSVLKDDFKNCGSALYIQGNIKILDEEGMPYENRNRTTLCRCGKSKNKPYCDGSHVKENFEG